MSSRRNQRRSGVAPVIHNRWLPDWLHRLANGIVGAGLAALIACVGVRELGLPLRAFAVVPLAAAVSVAAPPRRFSLVEGCAGVHGYDELDRSAGPGMDGRDRDLM